MMIVLGSKSNHHYDIACQIVGANTSSVLFSYKILELCFHTISVEQAKATVEGSSVYHVPTKL